MLIGRLLDVKHIVRQLGGYEAVKEFKAYKILCFNDSDFAPLIDGATTKFAVAQPNGSEKVMMAPITERRKLWDWLPAFSHLASITTQLLSMHTCASERNWSKLGLMFAKNRARLCIDRA